MFVAMAAAVAAMMFTSRALESRMERYPALIVSVFLSVAIYTLVTRLLGSKPPSGTD